MRRAKNQARWYPADRQGKTKATVAAGTDFLASPTSRGWTLSVWNETLGGMEVVPYPFASFNELREHVDIEAPHYARMNARAREKQRARTANEEDAVEKTENQGVPPEEKKRRRARGERGKKAKAERKKARVENPLGTLERLPKAARMWEAVYESAKERKFSDERSAKQAWGAVKAAGYWQDEKGVWHGPRAANEVVEPVQTMTTVSNPGLPEKATRAANRTVALPKPGDAPLVIESYGQTLTVKPADWGEWLVSSGPRRRIVGKEETLEDIEYFRAYGMLSPSTPGVWANRTKNPSESTKARTWLDEGAHPGDYLIFHTSAKYDDDFPGGYYDVMGVGPKGGVHGELYVGRTEQDAIAGAKDHARRKGMPQATIFRVTPDNKLRQVGRV